MYRILSLDGGGIRGLYTLVVLKRLEGLRPGWLGKADLVAGTSVGGIIALGIASGACLDDFIKLFSEKASSVFPAQKLAGKLKQSPLAGPRYPNDGLSAALKASFRDKTLGDLETGVMVSSFSMDNKGKGGRPRSWGPKFFHNLDENTGDLDIPCWKAALYTSAAPTFFPSVDGYIDGGVAVNNPAMCAFSLAKKHNPMLGDDENICLMSIGTGINSKFVSKETEGWGLVEWAPYILPLLMDAPSGIAEYQCSSILKENYMRLNSVISADDPVGLDEVSGVPYLVRAAQELDIEPAIGWLDRLWI